MKLKIFGTDKYSGLDNIILYVSYFLIALTTGYFLIDYFNMNSLYSFIIIYIISYICSHLIIKLKHEIAKRI
ncbi:hypothetical protein [Clostridium sp. ZS2-4]|uniref:hypothetical protein n=1 Tax=Clostridium sp. ZS2-4 TaxID=2987703 RepID=UPI00227B1D66|nr:hypothetical protein [Clostridium sp. ZS2-4]MCY6355957.1 hypothetical protein [Clostridium sp. ZS2-4]